MGRGARPLGDAALTTGLARHHADPHLTAGDFQSPAIHPQEDPLPAGAWEQAADRLLYSLRLSSSWKPAAGLLHDAPPPVSPLVSSPTVRKVLRSCSVATGLTSVRRLTNLPTTKGARRKPRTLVWEGEGEKDRSLGICFKQQS